MKHGGARGLTGLLAPFLFAQRVVVWQSDAMRKLAPFLLVAAVLSLTPAIPAPIGPSTAEAMDDPAFIDGGCIVTFLDGGTTVTIDTFRTSSWNASIAVAASGAAVCLRWCEASTGTDPATCAANRNICVGGPLKSDGVFDIAVPSNRRFLSMTSADAGSASICVGLVTP